MTRKNRLLSLPLSVLPWLSLCACTSLQSVSVTQIPSDRSRPVRAEVSNTALFGIHFDNDFVDELTADLLRQCPHGKVTGILTKQESSLHVLVTTRRVVATGWCVYDAPAPPTTESPQPPPPPEATTMREGG
jgi:hypothetical protein